MAVGSGRPQTNAPAAEAEPRVSLHSTAAVQHVSEENKD